jgi:hypothetical protein
MDDHFTQQWQFWFEMLPDPHRQSFAGRVVQAVDLVQIMMIEPVVQRLERRFDVGEIHHPAGLRIDFAADVEFDPERMPVQARTFVPGWNIRQPVCGLEGEDFEDVHGKPEMDVRAAQMPRPAIIIFARAGWRPESTARKATVEVRGGWLRDRVRHWGEAHAGGVDSLISAADFGLCGMLQEVFLVAMGGLEPPTPAL